MGGGGERVAAAAIKHFGVHEAAALDIADWKLIKHQHVEIEEGTTINGAICYHGLLPCGSLRAQGLLWMDGRGTIRPQARSRTRHACSPYRRFRYHNTLSRAMVQRHQLP